MMQQLCSSSSPKLFSDQCGAVYQLAIFAIIALLALAGLAIDAGNLYKAELQMQKAADAGVLAAISYPILHDDAPPITAPIARRNFLEDRAEEFIVENLRREGIIPSATPTVNYSQADESITATVTADIEFLLIDLVPFSIFGLSNVGSTQALSSTATAERRPAYLSIIADVSDSMACPPTGWCNCPYEQNSGPCYAPSGATRYDDMLAAIDDFLSHFDNSRDEINVVLIGTEAELRVPLDLATSGFSAPSFAGVAPGGYTNICDGLITGYKDMRDNGVVGREQIAYVLFSDGAVNAGRFQFSDVSGLTPYNPDGLGTHDYSHYTYWWPGPGPASWFPGGPYPGPSLLVQAGKLGRTWTPANAPAASTPACSPDPTNPPSAPGLFNTVFDSCLNSMEFHMPYTPAPGYGDNIGPVPQDFGSSWGASYYDCAISVSDFLRRQMGVVYTLGFGEPNTALSFSIAGNDPYQSKYGAIFRKDFLLSRIANDYVWGVPLAVANHGGAFPPFVYTNAQSYGALLNAAPQSQGRYFPTPSTQDMERAYRSIAQKILLRLVS